MRLLKKASVGGAKKPPMIITGITSFYFQIPVMVVVSRTQGANGVFLAYGLAFGFCLTVVWFFKGKWKQRELE